MQLFETLPWVQVADAEYRRLLGWPQGHEPGPRAAQLAAWAREWYARCGRPWLAVRQVSLELDGGSVRLDDALFDSPQLAAHLEGHGSRGAVLLAASAGPECEARAHQLWSDGHPDEYYFLEVFGSAVVEGLVARASAKICDAAAAQGLAAVPHYSPGYAGWDVAGQPRLFEVFSTGLGQPFPGPIEVLASGMLRPKKSILAVIGLAPAALAAKAAAPCERCPFSPCQFRRAPYRHSAPEPVPAQSGERRTPYTLPVRALRKWAGERVEIHPGADGCLEATFRFDGSTCSNLGHPLSFRYNLLLEPAGAEFRIRASGCVPADDGFEKMCTALEDRGRFLSILEEEKPASGALLSEAIARDQACAPSGCLCTPENRAHKWRLALETVSFALSSHPLSAPSGAAAPSHD